MSHKQEKSGTQFEKPATPSDKGTEFVDPLAPQGERLSGGYRVIDATKEPEPYQDADVGGDRRGAVRATRGVVTNSSANRVTTSEAER